MLLTVLSVLIRNSPPELTAERKRRRTMHLHDSDCRFVAQGETGSFASSRRTPAPNCLATRPKGDPLKALNSTLCSAGASHLSFVASESSGKQKNPIFTTWRMPFTARERMSSNPDCQPVALGGLHAAGTNAAGRFAFHPTFSSRQRFAPREADHGNHQRYGIEDHSGKRRRNAPGPRNRSGPGSARRRIRVSHRPQRHLDGLGFSTA